MPPTGARADRPRVIEYGASLALLQIEKPMAYTDPPSSAFGADGTQRHRGIETAVKRRTVEGCALDRGCDLPQRDAAEHGQRHQRRQPADQRAVVPVEPRAEYDIAAVHGLTLSARRIHTGLQYLDITNTMSIPARDRFDLGARYATELFGKKTTFRATMRNLASKSHRSSTIGGYLTQGNPRSAWLSMTTDF